MEIISSSINNNDCSVFIEMHFEYIIEADIKSLPAPHSFPTYFGNDIANLSFIYIQLYCS